MFILLLILCYFYGTCDIYKFLTRVMVVIAARIHKHFPALKDVLNLLLHCVLVCILTCSIQPKDTQSWRMSCKDNIFKNCNVTDKSAKSPHWLLSFFYAVGFCVLSRGAEFPTRWALKLPGNQPEDQTDVLKTMLFVMLHVENQCTSTSGSCPPRLSSVFID